MTKVTRQHNPGVNKHRQRVAQLVKNENGVLVIVLAALIAGIAVVTKGLTVKPVNISNVLLQSAIRGVAAVGETFVILTAGIDLSVGGVGLMTSVFGASLMTGTVNLNLVGHQMSPLAAIPIMLAVGTAWGGANGVSVARIGMPALIVTLAVWQMSKGVAFRICQGCSVMFLPESLAFFGKGVVAGLPVPVIIWIATSVVAYFILNYTKFGRSVYAVGGSPVSSWLSGINVRAILLSAYLIAGLLSGVAGVLITSRIMSASMQSLAGLEIDVISAVVIGGVSLFGGRGSVLGTVLGVLLIGVIDNGMSVMQTDPALIGITKGAIIFAAVAIDTVRRRESKY
jgi:ribose/xylose/arabinose/galactoside ABC-type transport system permease subunit